MHLCFSCISYLSFGTEIQWETKPQPCQILTNNNTLDRFVGYIVFAGRGHQVEDFSGLSLYKIAKRGFSMSDMAIWRPFNSTFIGAPVLKKRLFFFLFFLNFGQNLQNEKSVQDIFQVGQETTITVEFGDRNFPH